jgi:hypothetical protein
MIRQTLFSQFLLFSAVPVVAWAQFAGECADAGERFGRRHGFRAPDLSGAPEQRGDAERAVKPFFGGIHVAY